MKKTYYVIDDDGYEDFDSPYFRKANAIAEAKRRKGDWAVIRDTEGECETVWTPDGKMPWPPERCEHCGKLVNRHSALQERVPA